MAVAVAAGLASGLVVPTASADQISDLKAQAAAVKARIDALGLQESALAEKYDQAKLTLASLETKVASAQSRLQADQTTTDQARKALKQDVLQAYMTGGSDPLASGSGVASATTSLLRNAYESTLVTDQSEAIDSYHVAVLQQQADETDLKQQQTAAQNEVAVISADRTAVSNSANQLTALESHINGQVATLIAQQQAAEAAAAQAAAARARQIAAEQAAAAAAAAHQTTQSNTGTSTGTGGSTTNGTGSGSNDNGGGGSGPYTPPPGVSSAAAIAVAAAESRVGDWYVWAAAGPSTFDCSGLVMWAYAQAGVSLPHYSGAQYADTVHIPMSDLQPGDLVFFSDPGEHVAMYVGNGMIIEAPYTGATVHIIPMYSGFVLAGRVE
jgi:cell wall-associated NlpC family hydrolase